MGLFKSKPSASDQRIAGEMLAMRVALVSLLEAASADFPISQELVGLRAAGLLELGTLRAAPATVAGFGEFMRSFIAAAKRHS